MPIVRWLMVVIVVRISGCSFQVGESAQWVEALPISERIATQNWV